MSSPDYDLAADRSETLSRLIGPPERRPHDSAWRDVVCGALSSLANSLGYAVVPAADLDAARVLAEEIATSPRTYLTIQLVRENALKVRALLGGSE